MQIDTAGGGGGADAGFSMDPAAVHAAARALSGCAATVGAARPYGAVQGLGEARDVATATEAFRTTWDDSLRRWGEQLTTFGSTVSRVAGVVGDHDTAQAQAWRPVGGPLP